MMKVKLEGHYGYGRLIVSAVPLIALVLGGCLLLRLRKRYGYSG